MASEGSDTEESIRLDDDNESSVDEEFFLEDTEPENVKYDDLCTNEETADDTAIKRPLSFPDAVSYGVSQVLSRAIFASLLNDYVESEFFVIHGDSLIITCATNVSLTPGESLHFFFLLEQFLFNLTIKNGRYIIVFFKDFEDLHHPLMRCWRTQLMLHLRENSNIAVHTFPSFLCAEWKAFLKEQAPYFFMVSDQGINKQQTLYLNVLILNILGSRVNVVLSAGQESDNLRVYGYHVKAGPKANKYLQQNGAKFKEDLQQLITNVQKNRKEKMQSLLQYVNQGDGEKQVQECISLLSTCFKEQCDIRAVTCVVSCSVALKMHSNAENSQDQDDDLQLTLEEVADLCRMKCLCVTLMILLPLSQRAKLRRIIGEWTKNASLFVRLLQQCEHIVLDLTTECCKNKEINWTCVSDISDYLLLKNIAYYCEKEYNADLKLEFGKKIEEMYTILWASTLKLFSQGEHLNSFELRTTDKHFLLPETSVIVEQEILPVGLLPMKSDIIEDYAGDAIQELPILSSDDPVFSHTRRKPYDELRHWHSGRLLSDDYDRTKHDYDSILKDPWALRNYQKHQSFDYRYGQSLGVKTSKKIVVDSNQPEEKKCVHKVPAKKKAPQIKKIDQIREENLKKTKAIEESKELQQWKTLVLLLEKEIREDLSSGILKLEKFIKSLQTRTVKYHAHLRALSLCFELWIEHCKIKCEDQRDMNIVVEIMKIIQSVLTNYHDMLQGEDTLRVMTYLDQLGFQNLKSSFKGSEMLNKSEGGKSSYGVGVGSTRFQMKYMGPYLQRDERKDPDPRVQHFIPDTWQRELLDVVDNNESAVIVAPTSSGKTYASYYCMEKVLKQSNEAVVVYVAPTKALVNQVVATVKSQFHKDLPPGKVLCGVFTRDYRTDALNCQVLVTVPQCLEILLLSPHRQDWVKQIKYLIFDEVHCLGSEIGAEVWEHLLVMIRCPFLALSATISNPEHLTEWLQSVNEYWQQIEGTEDSSSSKQHKKGGRKKLMKREKRSYRVRLVCHDKRYNDLETHICSVQESDDVTFQHYHPFAALTLDHMMNYGIPKDLTFSPRESLQLYDAMVQAWPTCANIKALDPEENVHLKNKVIIKKDAIKYEEALKRELVDWIKKGHHKEVSNVLNSLKINEPVEEKDSVEYFPQLVELLAKIDKLPAIFFAFKLDIVEGMARKLDSCLKEKQKKKQSLDEKEVQKLIVKAEKLRKGLQGSFGILGSKSAITSSKQEALVTKLANYKTITKKIEMLTEIPPDCTYANEKSVDKKILTGLYRSMKTSRNRSLISLSKRGIGYHHSSVDAKGRRLVEMLFRMGCMKVVTATSSLALGINMPCESVVFLNDSVFLDALNYRQMAGRAGRRGLDLEGSVFFFNIPMPKVKKLMKSNVPELRGQFPLSISLVLRLMLLAAKADDKKDASAKVLSVLKHSLMSFKQPQETLMLKLYFIFSLQFLLTEGYLDPDCNPTEFTGLATHLHYHEPSNFVFVILLEKGLFHQLCKPVSKDSSKFSDSVMETLVLILANLFGKVYCSPSRYTAGEIFFQSKVFLGELPDDFAEAIEDYNIKIAKMFGHCILSASKLADMDKEYRLPLTKISFSGKECVDSALVSHLMSCSEGRSGISPFACLSGNTDHDLLKMANSSLMLQTVYIPDRHIPLLHLEKTDLSGRKMFLNSYALDFFKHGSLSAIEMDNGFNRGEAYYKLRDFYLAIASISVSMKELCEDENDPVVLAFEQLKTLYHEKLDRT